MAKNQKKNTQYSITTKRLLVLIAAITLFHLSLAQDEPVVQADSIEVADAPKPPNSAKDKQAKKYFQDKVEDFHLSIGYQFDFINKANPNSLYYDVSIFKRGKDKDWGIDFGIYQTGTNKTTATSSDPIRFYNESDFYKKLSGDDIQIVNRTYYRTFTTTSSFQSPALYISLIKEITPDLYRLVHVEFFGSNSRIALKDSLYQSDTTQTTFTQYQSKYPSVPIFGTKELRTSEYSSFVGGGLLFRQQISDDFLLRIKPIVGWLLTQRNDYSSTSLSSYFTTSPSFRIDIRLISHGKVPFKLGGQAVGDFETGFYGATFYLSKIFSPKKLGEFLTN